MPSNPNKEDYSARREIDLIITRTLPKEKVLLYSDLVRQISLTYAVSVGSIKRFIEEFYIEPGHIKLEDGFLKEKTEQK